MAGTVHVKLEIIPIGNDVLRRAHFVGIQQAHVQHALRQDFDGGFVGRYKSGAFMCSRNGGLLGGQHQVVQLSLGGGKCAIGWKRSGNVAGITIELTSGINQNQFTVADRASVGAIVQHARVGASRHDGAISGVLRAMKAKFVQELGIQVVLAHFKARLDHGRRAFHGSHVCTSANLCSAPHDVLFMRVFDQTHLVQNTAYVALLLWAQRAITDPGSHGAQTGFDAGRQLFVRGKGVPNHRFVF